MILKALRLVQSHINAIRHRGKTIDEIWTQGLEEEMAFWRNWIATKGDKWPDDYRQRLDPTTPLQDSVARWLPDTPEVSVLDVGAGPLTALGKVVAGKKLNLVACDALGDQYAALPFPPGAPPVPTLTCKTEELTQRFGVNQFDVVHASNTLDHSISPLEAIVQMVMVAKPGGYIVLSHVANEAKNEGYAGLHQWNFFVDGGRLWLGNRTCRQDVDLHLQGLAQPVEMPRDGAPHVYVVYQKLA